jgi:hypothetical protein
VACHVQHRSADGVTLALTLPPQWPSWAPPVPIGRRSALGGIVATARGSEQEHGEAATLLGCQRWGTFDDAVDVLVEALSVMLPAAVS